jgi:primosomal replication protein N
VSNESINLGLNDSSHGINRAQLSGVVLQKSILRYTPAGVALITLELNHHSQVQQAGSTRKIAFNLEATALGETAIAVDSLTLGKQYTFEGFWALAHYRSKRISFHVCDILQTDIL